MDSIHTMSVGADEPVSNPSAIPSVGTSIDARPDDGDDVATIPSSEDRVRGGGEDEGEDVLPIRDGASSPDADRPRRASKRRRVSCSSEGEGPPAAANDDDADRRLKEEDPFLYYSDDRRRLAHLLGRDHPRVVARPATPETTPTKRRTRLSFEVDPLLDLVGSYPELLDESRGRGGEGGRGENPLHVSMESLLSLL